MNLPFMSLTDMFSSLIWRSRRITSLCKKNISPSKLYHLSKYSLTIFFSSSSLADSMSFFGATSLRNDTLAFRCLSLLLFLELFGCLFSEQGTQFLLPLRGHKSLLLCHFAGCVLCVFKVLQIPIQVWQWAANGSERTAATQRKPDGRPLPKNGRSLLASLLLLLPLQSYDPTF